jgi:hypothetical protein
MLLSNFNEPFDDSIEYGKEYEEAKYWDGKLKLRYSVSLLHQVCSSADLLPKGTGSDLIAKFTQQ